MYPMLHDATVRTCCCLLLVSTSFYCGYHKSLPTYSATAFLVALCFILPDVCGNAGVLFYLPSGTGEN